MPRTETAVSPLMEADEPGWLPRAIRRARMASRRRRAALFHRHFAVGPRTRVLDLGGDDGRHIHYLLADTGAAGANVCVADIDAEATTLAASRFGYRAVALQEEGPLPFPDRYFDVVVCCSVLEHVTVPKREIWDERSGARFRRRALAAQRRFALELARVTQGYFVQVPCRYFPIETHCWLPFVGVLPRPLQCRVIAAANRHWIKRTIPDFYLPRAFEFAACFPGARLHRERFLGLTKSLIAIRAA